jgi:hypothetical protein
MLKREKEIPIVHVATPLRIEDLLNPASDEEDANQQKGETPQSPPLHQDALANADEQLCTMSDEQENGLYKT